VHYKENGVLKGIEQELRMVSRWKSRPFGLFLKSSF